MEKWIEFLVLMGFITVFWFPTIVYLAKAFYKGWKRG